jgi:hypothetical protein
MPGVRDKILINQLGLASFADIIRGLFDGIDDAMNAGEFIAREIEHYGWLFEADAQDFLKDQESDCAVIDAASNLFVSQLIDFHKKQLIRSDAMRLWVDKKLANQTTP